MNSDRGQWIPYGRQQITEDDVNAVVEVLKSLNLTQGPAVQAFEKCIAKKVEAEYAIAVNSATSALHLACTALDVGPGDYLWTSPITFVASANCGRYCGAEVDFVDIDLKSGLIEPSALKKKLVQAERDNVLPKALVTVHLAGTSCNMEEIASICNRYDIRIIEDASHAIGGTNQSRKVGSCEYSDATVFSFHPVKIVTTGEGGVVTTNHEGIAKRIERLRSHGITKNEDEFENESTGPWYYEQQELGFNFRMTDIQAALGLSQLGRLEEIVRERNRILQLYVELTHELPVRMLEIPKGVTSAGHLAVVQLNSHSRHKHEEVFAGLRNEGFGVQLHYCPVHLQPYYRKRGFREGMYPQAESYAKSSMSLPIYPGLKNFEVERIVKTLKGLLEE